jgi:phospholipid/cholesterol/gamma-HCH transport system ATP-binding protein
MIRLDQVTKSFGPKEVLRGIDLTVETGESLVVIGGSGTGKSVLLKCILGLVKPDGGTIELDGRTSPPATATRSSPASGCCSRAGRSSIPCRSGRTWPSASCAARGKRPKAEAREIAIEKLRRVGLDADVADLYPAELSGGMQKRASLARAIAADPDIIFFDEPTTGLDPIMAGVINDLIREIVTEMGVTAITITHDMTSARPSPTRSRCCTRARSAGTGTWRTWTTPPTPT